MSTLFEFFLYMNTVKSETTLPRYWVCWGGLFPTQIKCEATGLQQTVKNPRVPTADKADYNSQSAQALRSLLWGLHTIFSYDYYLTGN